MRTWTIMGLEGHCNDACILGMMIDRLAYYEDLEEQGFIKACAAAVPTK